VTFAVEVLAETIGPLRIAGIVEVQRIINLAAQLLRAETKPSDSGRVLGSMLPTSPPPSCHRGQQP